MSASIFTTQTPGGSFSDAAPGLTLGTLFLSDVAGQISGIRWFFPSTLPDSTIGLLYSYTSDTTGVELARATFSSPVAGTWNTVTFSSPVAITAGTLYVAAVLTPDWYVATGTFFASSGVTNGHLTALANDGATPNTNGKFHVGATAAFPEQHFNASCYFVDVLFDVATTSVDVGDSASEADSASVAATLGVTEAGAISDATTPAPQPALADGATLAETVSVVVTAGTTDPLAVVETVGVAVPGQDVSAALGPTITRWSLGATVTRWATGPTRG